MTHIVLGVFEKVLHNIAFVLYHFGVLKCLNRFFTPESRLKNFVSYF